MNTMSKTFGSILIVALSGLFFFCSNTKKSGEKVTFGVIADVHQDLQADARLRLHSFLEKAKEQNPDFVIQLGDLSHGTTLDSILVVWNQYTGSNYHVLGNHDTDNLSKEDVLKKQNMPSRYYSYDCNGVHFIVLDLNYILDNGEYKDFNLGNNYNVASENKNLISPAQLEWLENDLASTNKPSIVFSHQGIGDLYDGWVSPSNKEIRKIFAKANQGGTKKVIACFAGDQHVESYEVIEDVHYFQINSASYYWIDGSQAFSNGNMAEYKDPLYAFVTVDLDKRTIEIEGVKSEFLPPVPSAENYENYEIAHAEIKSRKVEY